MSTARTDGISRFFAPKLDISNRLQNENSGNNKNKKCKRTPLINDHAEWEKPIGLTPEAAIEIPDYGGGDDHDDDDHGNNNNNNNNNDDNDDNDNIQDRPLLASSGSCSQIVTETSPQDHVNPFQEFAYQIGGCETSYFSSLSTTDTTDSKEICVGKVSSATNMNKRDIAAVQCSDISNIAINTTTLQIKRRQRDSAAKQPKRDRKTNKKKRADSDLPFLQMTPADQERCKVKWQSFTDEDDPLEIRRFQVFIAARLHCQAHENTVRAAMLSLRKFFSSSVSTTATSTTTIDINATVINDDSSGGEKSQPIGEQTDNDLSSSQSQCAPQSPSSSMLCPETLSKADPSAISQLISSVLFANVKSKQLIKAANEINVRFKGRVPETQHGLQQLTGIGPKLGELLHHVNSNKAYDR